MNSGLFKNIREMFTHHVYLIYKSKQDLALNKLQCLIWHKTKSTYKEMFLKFELLTYVKLNYFEMEQFLHFIESKENCTYKCIKIHLALNNLKWLTCHKTKSNQSKSNQI